MRYYVMAGELSGDMHAAALIRAIRKRDPDAEFRGLGGDLCREAGMYLHRHYSVQNVMGFVEILRHLPQLLRFLKASRMDMLEWKPDVLILVDYPGFNLRMAKFGKQAGIPVDYFIPPQVWAWNRSRVLKLKKYCRQLLCILPFEPAFYQNYGITASYVGNPLLEHWPEHEQTNRETGTLLLMPGSRSMEVKRILPEMLKAAQNMPEFSKIVVAGVSILPESLYHEIIGDAPVQLDMDSAKHWQKRAEAAFVTSGTATLEAALAGIPQVVCYRGQSLSVALARLLIKVPYISLVNLLANPGAVNGIPGNPVVPECIQNECNSENLVRNMRQVLENRNFIQEQYKAIRNRLSTAPGADAAAELIIRTR